MQGPTETEIRLGGAKVATAALYQATQGYITIFRGRGGVSGDVWGCMVHCAYIFHTGRSMETIYGTPSQALPGWGRI